MVNAYHVHFLQRYKTTDYIYQRQLLCFMKYKGHAQYLVGRPGLPVDMYH